jgi:hypothetical protein
MSGQKAIQLRPKRLNLVLTNFPFLKGGGGFLKNASSIWQKFSHRNIPKPIS